MDCLSIYSLYPRIEYSLLLDIERVGLLPFEVYLERCDEPSVVRSEGGWKMEWRTSVVGGVIAGVQHLRFLLEFAEDSASSHVSWTEIAEELLRLNMRE